MLRLFDHAHALTFTRFALLLLSLVAGTVFLTSGARAEVISISGTAFIQQCPCPSSGNVPDVNNGVLFPTDQSTLYASVDFSANGLRICRFTLVYHDVNGGDAMTARLFRKNSATGSNPFTAPAVLATLTSAPGVVDTVRRATTTAISLPVINENSGFYFVQVSAPTINLNLLGVQIDYRQTCP